ncbi:MAG TPA: diaminopimelate epimerase [Polyangiaceae bacterium]|jgi:diaminopimelate epimerase|nr:diaminopimelate epimerase [Polyangiaceae bacterium]
MAGTLAFEKYEGLGNDFVVLEAAGALSTELVTRICDRHFGVGADGVLIVAPAQTDGARARMIVQNADGSRPEMCGNGLRCVALHLAKQAGVDRAEFVVDTDAGPRRCKIERHDDEASVAIDMGRAERLGEYRTTFDRREYVFERVSTGNPHAICLGVFPDLAIVDRLGPQVSAAIPGGTNVEFVAMREPRAFDVVVWERGVGRTLACGTGAVATGAALGFTGRVPFGEPLAIRLPGGTLEVSVGVAPFETTLRGPARRVFGGTVAGRLTPP